MKLSVFNKICVLADLLSVMETRQETGGDGWHEI